MPLAYSMDGPPAKFVDQAEGIEMFPENKMKINMNEAQQQKSWQLNTKDNEKKEIEEIIEEMQRRDRKKSDGCLQAINDAETVSNQN